MDYDRTREVLSALEAEGVRYVIIGAVALNLQGLARATQALDIFIAPDGRNVERLQVALRRVFDDPHVDEITAEDLLGDYPAVQYVPPEGTFHLDILTRLGEAFQFEDLESERVDFDGVEVSVVTPRMLYRMKRATVRPQDRADAEHLPPLRPRGRVMSVRRCRDVSEMEGNVWLEPGDEKLFRAIRAVWELATRSTDPRFPPGVYKQRSIEAVNALQEDWERANFEAFHARRHAKRRAAHHPPHA